MQWMNGEEEKKKWEKQRDRGEKNHTRKTAPVFWPGFFGRQWKLREKNKKVLKKDCVFLFGAGKFITKRGPRNAPAAPEWVQRGEGYGLSDSKGTEKSGYSCRNDMVNF